MMSKSRPERKSPELDSFHKITKTGILPRQESNKEKTRLNPQIHKRLIFDWKNDGFGTLVVATDSTYVLDGATSWVQGWIRNGWKTRAGGDVKNQDLWKLLLGEVERWESRGLGVQLWKIPRELNSLADMAAKEAAQKTPVPEFRDVAHGISSEITPDGPVRVLKLCLESESMVDAVHGTLLSQIKAKAFTTVRATTAEAALAILNQEPPPSVIFVADGGITRQKKVYERVVDRLRGGATVVLAGCYSSMVSAGQFSRFFTRLGIPWDRGPYHRTTVSLRPAAVGAIPGANRLPASYSQKALFVKNIERSAAWYTERESCDEAAVAWIKVGLGRLGYVGDVNGENESTAVVMAMCGLL